MHFILPHTSIFNVALSHHDFGIIVAIQHKIDFLTKAWQNLKLFYALLPPSHDGSFCVNEFRFSIKISPRMVPSLVRNLGWGHMMVVGGG